MNKYAILTRIGNSFINMGYIEYSNFKEAQEGFKKTFIHHIKESDLYYYITDPKRLRKLNRRIEYKGVGYYAKENLLHPEYIGEETELDCLIGKHFTYILEFTEGLKGKKEEIKERLNLVDNLNDLLNKPVKMRFTNYRRSFNLIIDKEDDNNICVVVDDTEIMFSYCLIDGRLC